MINHDEHVKGGNEKSTHKGSKAVSLGLAGVMLTTALSQTACNDTVKPGPYGLVGDEVAQYYSARDMKKSQLHNIFQEIVARDSNAYLEIGKAPLILDNKGDTMTVMIMGAPNPARGLLAGQYVTVCAFNEADNTTLWSYSIDWKSGQIIGVNIKNNDIRDFESEDEEFEALDRITSAMQSFSTYQVK